MTSKTYSVEGAKAIANFLLDTAEAAGRTLTSEEELLYQSIVAQIKAASPETAGRKTVNSEPHVPNAMIARPSGSLFKNTRGELFQAYRYGENFTEASVQPGECGEVIRAMLLGEELPKGVQKLQNSAGIDPTGTSFSIPLSISSRLIDLARAQSICMRAGAQTMPLPTDSAQFVKVLNDPELTWKSPWEAINVSQPTFDRVNLELKSLAGIVARSFEAAESTVNLNQALEDVLVNAIAGEIDRAILAGAGTKEPVGILNTSDVHEVDGQNAPPTDYTNVLTGIRKILNSNCPTVEQLSWASSPTVQSILQNCKATVNGDYLTQPKWVQQLKGPFETTKLQAGSETNSPNDVVCTDVIGDFSQVLVGVRPNGLFLRV